MLRARNTLPKGWIKAPIKELCSLINGRAFKLSEWSESGLPIVRIQNLNNPAAPYNYCNKKIDDKFHINKGELLFAWSGTPGTSFGAHIWKGEHALLNQHIFRILFDETLIDKKFFRLALNERLNSFISKAHGGVGLRHITKHKFEDTEILLPPSAEQDRIVAKVDELLNSVARTKERLEKVPAILDSFRKAVLDAACSGRLTEDWREKHSDVEPALELAIKIRQKRMNDFERACQEAKSKRRPKKPNFTDIPAFDASEEGLPESWVRVSGAALLSWSSGKFLPRKKQEVGDYPVYGGNGISGHHNKYLVANSTLVIGRVGANCGNVYVTEREAWITDNAIYAGYVPSDVVLQYLYLVFKNANLNARSGGSGQPFVNQTVLDELSIPLPPLAEQKEIARQAEKLFSLADTVQMRLAVAIKNVGGVAQAVLSKAFQGELVPTEAELAKKEGREYETAEQLLARIKVEREKQPKEKRKVRKIMKGKTTKKKATPFEDRENQVFETILKAKGKKVTPEQLFKMAGFSERSIDDFYEELRAAVKAGQIRESRPKKTEIYLEAINK